MENSLRDGYTVRPATVDDADCVATLWNDRAEAIRGRRPATTKRVLKRWDHPNFVPATDSRLVFAPDGALIGYAHIRDVRNPPVDVFGGYSVHPSYNEAAWLWDDLFDWMEAEARRVIAKAPADARIVLVAGAMDDDVCEQRELERHDFEHSRTFHRMSIDFDASLSRPVLPDGITFRTFAPGQDDEAIVSAYREAFADHFGYLDQPFAVDLAEWHRWMEADDFDPSLWLLAEDGGEVAGFLTSYVEAPGDPSRGWVDELGVRPRWRRRGIGRALLIHAFAALAERGVAGAVLTVDTQNKCGAPKLYEHVGMHSIHANHTYIKELRPGRNLVAG